MKKTFSITEVFRQGFNSFKSKAWFFIGISFLYVLVSAIPTVIDNLEKGIVGLGEDPIFIMLSAIIQIATFILGLIMPIGYTYILLRAVDNQTVSVRDLFSSHKVFWRFILAGILMTVATIIGFILLIIPAIFLSTVFIFVSYIIVDDHVKPMQAIRKSYYLTKGIRWKILGFILVIALINIVGLIALGVGFLFTMPLSGLASVHLYKHLKHQDAEVVLQADTDPEVEPTRAPEMLSV